MQIRHAFLALLLIGANAGAQSAASPAANKADTAAAGAAARSEPATEAALREKVKPDEELAPAVSIRQVGSSTVEEYRQSGRLYMVVVHPQHGPSYSFIDTNGDGRLENDPKDGPITPVFYTLYRFK